MVRLVQSHRKVFRSAMQMPLCDGMSLPVDHGDDTAGARNVDEYSVTPGLQLKRFRMVSSHLVISGKALVRFGVDHGNSTAGAAPVTYVYALLRSFISHVVSVVSQFYGLEQFI